MRTSSLVLTMLAASLGGGLCLADPAALPCAFQASQWNSQVPDGVAGATMPNPSTVLLSYDVNLGDPGPGVTARTATFTTVADADGVLIFDWSLNGFHAFASAEAGCIITSELSTGAQAYPLVPVQSVFGTFGFTGKTSIMVESGRPVTVSIFGSNYDSNSRMMGSLAISNAEMHTDFASTSDPYRAGAWSSTGIQGGTTTITAGGTPAGMTAEFFYRVNLGNPGPGVSYRSAEYSTVARGDGPVTFNWNWEAYHAFYMVTADLHAFADGPQGRTVVDLATGWGGGFNLSGTGAVDVKLGYRFGLLVGGSNFDSDSQLIGTVRLSGFNGPRSFDAAYQPQLWTVTPMPEGTTSLIPSCGPTDSLSLDYRVNLGDPGPGVPWRSAAMSVVADRTGVASMDWSYTGFHAFYMADVSLTAFADTAGGRVTVPVFAQGVFGSFSAFGCLRLNVESGYPFGIIAAGSNYDSNSALIGTVTLSNFSMSPTGPCLADFNLSGAVTVQDIFDFLAAYFAGERRADVNCSGTVGVQDIFDFLAAYFPGC